MSAMARLFLALAATVASGILYRLYPIGWYPYDDALGDVLYGVAAYLVLALLLLRKPPLLIALQPCRRSSNPTRAASARTRSAGGRPFARFSASSAAVSRRHVPG